MAIYLHNIHLMLHATLKGKLVILGKIFMPLCHVTPSHVASWLSDLPP